MQPDKQRIVHRALFAVLLFAHGILMGAEHPIVFPTPHWQNLDPAARQERWRIDGLEKVEALWTAMRDDHQSTALMVVERGEVVLGLGPLDKPVGCHSMRKSILSALFGTLPPSGRHLEDTLASLGLDDVPPLTSEEKEARVMDLLTARSGIYHAASYETAAMKKARPARGSHAPGTFFYYNNWDFNAMGTLFTKFSGLGIGDAFEARFAKPMGMEDFSLARDFRLLTDQDKPSIHPAYPIDLSTRDRARFGLMFLVQGRWASSQIVPTEWVKTSTQPSSAHSFGKGSEQLGNGQGYGMLWWCSDNRFHFNYRFPDNSTFSARGVGGQYIVVIPSRSLVVVHTNDTDVPGTKEAVGFRDLFQAILEAQKTSPLAQ